MRPPHSLRSLGLALCLVLVGPAFGGTSTAHAKTSRKVSHSYEKVWPTAVRFLRIDEGLEVLEKDMENGYLLFELQEEGKTFRGAIEVIRRKDSSNRDSVELILTLKERPSYMEHGILDRMLRKIRAELGLPKDEGEDEDEDDNPSKKTNGAEAGESGNVKSAADS